MKEKRFYCGKPVAGTSTTIVSPTKDLVIKEFIFCNTDNENAADITISLKGDDGTFYSIFNYKTVPSNGTVIVPLSLPMSTTAILTARAYTAGAINVVVSGVEM